MTSRLRYTKNPFPSYRFIPGKTPHPVIHPEGHSYGKPEEKPERLPPEAWRENEFYLFGIDLFNYGYWWEAHEAWEGLWLLTAKHDLEGQFLQALIQFSASLIKIYSGQWPAFEKLYHDSTRRFHFCVSEMEAQRLEYFMGLDLKAWLTEQSQFVKTARLFQPQSLDVLDWEIFPAIFLKR